MGILAVFDTFLTYKIADIRYNRKVGFISAALFAVMPATWFLRRIYLDSILLPFLLLSILCAVYYAKRSGSHSVNNNGINKNISIIIYSWYISGTGQSLQKYRYLP